MGVGLGREQGGVQRPGGGVDGAVARGDALAQDGAERPAARQRRATAGTPSCSGATSGLPASAHSPSRRSSAGWSCGASQPTVSATGAEAASSPATIATSGPASSNGSGTRRSGVRLRSSGRRTPRRVHDDDLSGDLVEGVHDALDQGAAAHIECALVAAHAPRSAAGEDDAARSCRRWRCCGLGRLVSPRAAHTCNARPGRRGVRGRGSGSGPRSRARPRRRRAP